MFIMVAPIYPTWRETLPIQTRSIPGVTIQPDPDPVRDLYPTQNAAQTALTAYIATGVTAGYYGIWQRPDGQFRLWPNAVQPIPGTKVA